MTLRVGRWYRLRFPGTFAKVIEYNVRNSHPYLVQTLIMRSKWWVDDRGRPNNHCSPPLKLKL